MSKRSNTTPQTTPAKKRRICFQTVLRNELTRLLDNFSTAVEANPSYEASTTLPVTFGDLRVKVKWSKNVFYVFIEGSDADLLTTIRMSSITTSTHIRERAEDILSTMQRVIINARDTDRCTCGKLKHRESQCCLNCATTSCMTSTPP